MSKPKRPKRVNPRKKGKPVELGTDSNSGSSYDMVEAAGDLAEVTIDLLASNTDLPSKTVKPITPDFQGAGGDFGGGGADASFDETSPPAVIDTADISLLDSVTSNFAAAADDLGDTANSALEVAGNLASGAADVAGDIASGVGEVLGSLDL